MDSHVIPEVTFHPKDFATDLARYLLVREHLVVDGQMAILVRKRSVIGAKVALPHVLCLWVCLKFWNWIE